jgi:hypothetical protein
MLKRFQGLLPHMQSFYFQGFVLFVQASSDIGHIDWHDQAGQNYCSLIYT